MKIDDKLAEWQARGLLDAEAAARIAAYERDARPKRPYLLYAASGLGALSVAIGLLSIVASNWEAIPAALKLVLDLGLLAGLAAAIWRAERASWMGEVLILVFHGAVLASIALVGQIYQMGGTFADALLLWSLITAPIALHGHGRFFFAVWVVGLQTSALVQLDRLQRVALDYEKPVLVLTFCYALCIVAGAVGASRFVARVRPALARVAGGLGRIELVLLATFAPLFLYDRWVRDDARTAGLAGSCLVLVLLCSLAVVARDDAGRGPGRGGAFALAVVAALAAYLPWLVTHEHPGPTAAASFLVVWSVIGYWAYRRGRIRLLNLATALLGVRLLIVYFEVFGSLLDTGIGLVSGGLLTLLIAWFWVKKARRWGRAQEPS
jgi:uncharacterized membrane protein